MLPRRALAMGSLAAATLAGCGAEPSMPLTPSLPARGDVIAGVVVSVSDGDTIGVRVADRILRVRLVGIDAPETTDLDGEAECFGREASRRLQVLLARNAPVTLVTDPTQDRIDRYGRTLAYVFRRGERVTLNERLVAEGAARVYVYRRGHPPKRIGALRRAESAARSTRSGLWGACR